MNYSLMLIGAYEPVKNLYSDELSTLINSMLQRDPESRPSIKEILMSPMVVSKAKEFKITIPIKRIPKSPGCKKIFKTLKTTNSQVKYLNNSHKSQRSVLQSRNGSSNFLRKGKRSLKPKGSSVVLGDK
jgi:serine/threonine protein kinase